MEADIGISKLLDMPGGFEKIALEMIPPFIREQRDYISFGRKIVIAHNVTADELHLINNEPYYYYPKDFESTAAFYGADGMAPRTQIEGSGVDVGIATIESNDTTLNLKRLLVQKFNYLERVRELSGQAVAKLEDIRILALAETLLKGNGTDASPQFFDQIVTTSDTSLKKSHLVDLKARLSQHDVPLGAFVINPRRLDDTLKWDQDEVDEQTLRETLQEGVKYVLWGVKFYTSILVDKDIVYAFSTPELTGRMPILKDLTVKLTETANKLEQGLFLFEFVGFYLSSQKSIAKLIIDYTAGDDLIAVPASDSVVTGSVPADGVGTVA